MTFATANISLRPIRFGCWVDPKSPDDIESAVQIFTNQWGGDFNPLLPNISKSSPKWKSLVNFSATDIKSGYVDAYDPDVFIHLGDAPNSNRGEARKHISSREIEQLNDRNFRPRYGTGAIDLISNMAREEFKYVRKDNLKFVIPRFSGPNALFYKCYYGCYPRELQEFIVDRFSHIIDIEFPEIGPENYLSDRSNNWITPLGLTRWYLRWYSKRTHVRNAIFFMDMSSPLDIFDFWNLRALGYEVLPVDSKESDSDYILNESSQFISSHCVKNELGQDVNPSVVIIPGRTKASGVPEVFFQGLQKALGKNAKGGTFSVMPTYPSVWYREFEDANGVASCHLESEKEYQRIESIEKVFSLQTIGPAFSEKSDFFSEYRYANEFDFSVYNESRLFAEVFPEDSNNMSREITGVGLGNWRASRRGLVHLVTWHDRDVSIEYPTSKQIWSTWLQRKGLSIKQSSAGKTCEQALKQIGEGNLMFFTNKKFLELIFLITKGKAIHLDTIDQKVSELASRERYEKADVMKFLTEKRVIGLGVMVECGVCSRDSWYKINQMDYRLKCDICLEEFDVPTHDPKALAWAYRGLGPFSIPNNKADGAATVLLMIRFFRHVYSSHSRITPILGFEGKRGSKEFECDLGLFHQEEGFGRSEPSLIFAECKSNNEFKQKDADRMHDLGTAFPGSHILFATLNPEVSQDEIDLIKPLVEQSWNLRLRRKPCYTIGILTRHELTSQDYYRDTWKELGGKHEAFGKVVYRSQTPLTQFCDFTQSLYLRNETFSEWLKQQRVRPKKR